METQAVTIDRAKARDLYRKYKAHAHYSAPIDREIQRTYQLIAQGRVVIQALASIKAAGLHVAGPNATYPKLALARADVTEIWTDLWRNGAAEFRAQQWSRRGAWEMSLPEGTFPPRQERTAGRAVVPIIPIHLRPKRGLQNYHVLWEAEWTRTPPVDPMLLRRIGKGDAWLVVAAWDLTPVEQAALSARIPA